MRTGNQSEPKQSETNQSETVFSPGRPGHQAGCRSLVAGGELQSEPTALLCHLDQPARTRRYPGKNKSEVDRPGKFHWLAEYGSRSALGPRPVNVHRKSTRWGLDYFASGDCVGSHSSLRAISCFRIVDSRTFHREISEGAVGKEGHRPAFCSHDRDRRHCFTRNDRGASAT